jgi:hypothetical protein
MHHHRDDGDRPQPIESRHVARAPPAFERHFLIRSANSNSD